MLIEIVAAGIVGWAIGRISGGSSYGNVAPGHIPNGPRVTAKYTAAQFAAMHVAQRKAHMVDMLGAQPTIRPKIGVYTPGEAEALLQGGLVGLNLYQLRKGVPGISLALHKGIVRYEKEDPDEEWKSIREIWADPHFNDGKPFEDCEGLACAVAAERIYHGLPSQVMLHKVHANLSHVVVVDLNSGKLLDPSKTGGMGGRG